MISPLLALSRNRNLPALSLYSSRRERCRHPVKTLHRNLLRLAAPSHVGHYSVRRGSAQGQPTSAGRAPPPGIRRTIRRRPPRLRSRHPTPPPTPPHPHIPLPN